MEWSRYYEKVSPYFVSGIFNRGNVKIKEYLREEETPVGRFDNYKIFVYTEPLGNPSFHFLNNTGDTSAVFQIKDFKLLERKTKKLFSNKEMEGLKNWLGKKSDKKGFEGKTNWQVLLILWNVCNEKYEIDINLKMPE